jgi:hypothetical protein
MPKKQHFALSNKMFPSVIHNEFFPHRSGLVYNNLTRRFIWESSVENPHGYKQLSTSKGGLSPERPALTTELVEKLFLSNVG